jgi:hypothetical protein
LIILYIQKIIPRGTTEIETKSTILNLPKKPVVSYTKNYFKIIGILLLGFLIVIIVGLGLGSFLPEGLMKIVIPILTIAVILYVFFKYSYNK